MHTLMALKTEPKTGSMMLLHTHINVKHGFDSANARHDGLGHIVGWFNWNTIPLFARGCGVAKATAMIHDDYSVKPKNWTDRGKKTNFKCNLLCFICGAAHHTCALYHKKFNAKLLNARKKNLKLQVNVIETPSYTVHTHVDWSFAIIQSVWLHWIVFARLPDTMAPLIYHFPHVYK